MTIKKLLLLFCLLIFCSDFALAKKQEQLVLNSRFALVIDADTTNVLFEKNSEKVRSIASITKLMTAVVALDAQQDLDELITITNEDVKATSLTHRRTSNSLPVGTTLTRAELLHLALMNSQNRAAYAIARTFPGGVERFVMAMNNKADMLGMNETDYVDPTGLYNDNVSTPQDLAVLVRHAYDYELIRDFSTSTSYEMTSYSKRKPHTHAFGTTNRLLVKEDWIIMLQKTGYIHKAGHCLVMLTSVLARPIVIVLLDADSSRSRALDAVKIKFWLENNHVPSAKDLSTLDPYNKVHKYPHAR